MNVLLLNASFKKEHVNLSEMDFHKEDDAIILLLFVT